MTVIPDPRHEPLILEAITNPRIAINHYLSQDKVASPLGELPCGAGGSKHGSFPEHLCW